VLQSDLRGHFGCWVIRVCDERAPARGRCLPAAQEDFSDQRLDGGHRGFQRGAFPVQPPIRPGFPGERLGATLRERQAPAAPPQLRHQRSHPPDPTQRLRDVLPGPLHAHRAAPHVLKQAALKRSAALRAMRVDAAPSPLQRAARQQQQPAVRVIVIGLQPQDLQSGGFGPAGELHVGKQRPVATQPAPRAQRIGQARFHAGMMADRAARWNPRLRSSKASHPQLVLSGRARPLRRGWSGCARRPPAACRRWPGGGRRPRGRSAGRRGRAIGGSGSR